MKRGFVRNIKLAGMWAFILPGVLLSYFMVWLDRLIMFPLPFPRDIDELAKKKQWCLKVLKEKKILPEEAEVNTYKVIPLRQDIIFRSNAGVIEIGYTRQGNEETLKCFAKFAPIMGSIWNRTIFNIQLNHIKEIYFNREFVGDQCVQAPEAYFTSMSVITGNLCLITEYMDQATHYLDSVYESLSPGHLELVLDGMASLHACYWKDSSRRMGKIFPIGAATVDLFDSIVARQWSTAARKVLVKSWNIMNENQTVLHGDARIGNMMFPAKDGSGRFVFIDWQAVRKGKAVYDLVYFLILSLRPESRAEVEEKAIESYYRRLVERGVSDYPWEDFQEDYRHACLCLLILLSLPMLSGEASVEGDGAVIFAWGMNVWRERLRSKFDEFDYQWMADRYGITEQEGKEAIEEMLNVIYTRLKRVTGDRDFENPERNF